MSPLGTDHCFIYGSKTHERSVSYDIPFVFFLATIFSHDLEIGGIVDDFNTNAVRSPTCLVAGGQYVIVGFVCIRHTITVLISNIN